jgi:nucleoside phosphorylase
MKRTPIRPPHPPRALGRSAVVVAFALFVCACGSDDGQSSPPPFIAVLSAFPAELAPLVEQATVDETVDIEGRIFRLGTLAGTRVILGLTGIGLVNAENTTRAMLDRFDVTGIVVSAVGGSFLRIGDVTVPERWTFIEGAEYTADAAWLARAARIAADGDVILDRCTLPPNRASDEVVCVLHEPSIFVGGLGRSSDPFNGQPLPCRPDGSPVFGCDIAPGSQLVETDGLHHSPTSEATEPLAAEDMETAAIAREAVAHGLPFIAFRGVSDGDGDPLDLPGFPSQFFTYYNLAARNAAAATIAFLDEGASRREVHRFSPAAHQLVSSSR